MIAGGIDWTVTASLATAAGTLVLAIATFGSVRSANRSAKASELALQEGLRPVLTESRPDDPTLKIGFIDEHWVRVDGGRAGVELSDDAIYFVISLRNIGQGIGVCQAWDIHPTDARQLEDPAPAERFRPQSRDLYVPPGGVALWQGALRDLDDETAIATRDRIKQRGNFTIDLLYSDMAGGQRTVSRFRIQPASDTSWLAPVVRHWMLDRPGPR